MSFVVGLDQVRIAFLGLAADAGTACCSPCCQSCELVSIPATGSSSAVDSFSFPGPTPRATESPHVLFKHFSLLFCSFSIDDSGDCALFSFLVILEYKANFEIELSNMKMMMKVT